MKLELVLETLDPVEANAVKEQLETAGIPVALMNETSTSALGQNPDSAARIMVPAEDLPRAQKLVRTFLGAVQRGRSSASSRST